MPVSENHTAKPHSYLRLRSGPVASGETLRAAGGVVWRRDPSGALEVLVIHRPRYSNYVAKSKLLHRERDEQAALREAEDGLDVRARPPVLAALADAID